MWDYEVWDGSGAGEEWDSEYGGANDYWIEDDVRLADLAWSMGGYFL